MASPVLRRRVNSRGVEKELDAVLLSLGGGDVQRRPTVVVTLVQVNALQIVPRNEGRLDGFTKVTKK